MPTHVAFLRGINVGGKNMLSMADLKSLLASLGYPGATSLLQSGNVLVDIPPSQNLAALEERLKSETAARHRISPDFFLCTAAEVQSLIARNPFPAEAASDPGHLLVTFLKHKPAAKNIASLRAAIQGREILAPGPRELYIVYPDGIGRSKLTHALIEKHLAQPATGRNWNTLQKLAAMLQA